MRLSPETEAAMDKLIQEALDYRSGVQKQIGVINDRIIAMNMNISKLWEVVNRICDKLEKEQ